MAQFNLTISQVARPIAFVFPAFSSLVLIVWVLIRCRHGLELTDEGYYLNWISQPWNFDASVTQFGFVYRPLYLLAEGDVALLRRMNVSLLLLLGVLLSYTLFWSIGNERARDRSPQGLWVCSAIAASGSTLVLLSPWLPTPNYNSLAMQSLMLAAIGAVLAKRNHSALSILGWLLIGIGGGVTFLAKPSSALVLSLMMPAYLAVAGKLNLRGLAVAIVASIVIVGLCAIAIDGYPSAFVGRLMYGKQLAEIVGAGYQLGDVFRFDRLEMSGRQTTVFVCFMLAASLSAGFSFLAKKNIWPLSAVVASAVLVLVVLAATGRFFPNPAKVAFQAPQLLAVAIGTGIAWFATSRCRALLTRDIVALLVLFLLLPFTYAIGTATNFWAAASRAAIFWLLAGLMVCAVTALASRDNSALPLIGALALLVPCYVLTAEMEAPYRQTRALRLQAIDTKISGAGARLLLAEDAAAYVNGIRKVAFEAGFREGDPLLDLTGTSPTTAYVLGARPPGVPWIPAGYSGTTDHLIAALKHTPCELLRHHGSWSASHPSLRRLLML
jgi:hypothetical protein